MNNEERLIPFLGGLVIGGAAGSQTNKYPYYNNYPYAYYPMNYNSQPYYYQNQYIQPVPMNQTYYTYNDYQNGNIPLASNDNSMYQQRNYIDLSYVPIYKKD